MDQWLLNETLQFTLLDHHPDPTMYYTPVFDKRIGDTIVDFKLVYGNTAAAQGIGIDVTALSGQTVLTVSWADKETRRTLFQSLLHVYQTGENLEITYHNPVLDRHFKTLRRKVGDGILTIARDVTIEFRERVEKERQLAFSTLILDTSLNGWFCCECIRDEAGTLVDFLITRINPVFSRITGYTEKEIAGKTFLTLFPTARHNGIFELNCRVVASGESARQQIHYNGDGLDAWYDVVVTMLGKNGILVTFADITVTKQLAEAAQQSAEALQTVFNATQTGMFTFAPEYNKRGEIIDFRFKMVNAAISAYSGKPPEAFIGELGTAWFAGYLTNGEFDLYKRCFETGEPQQKEIRYTIDGHTVYLYLQSVKIGDQLLVTLTDYSLLRQYQHELEQTINALERSNKNLEEFAYAASHDLKEPVRKIQVFADWLKQQLAGKVTKEEMCFIERVQNAAERMELLVDDLLAYSYVSDEAENLESVDLNEKLRQVQEDLELTIQEKMATIQVEPLPAVKGQGRQLQQLFQNLLSNALKYSKPDVPPVINIAARIFTLEEATIKFPQVRQDRQYHLIEVADNGIGFEQGQAEKIFQVFTRLHGRSEYAGTGIGLSIVRKVVDNHHGYIWAESKPGEGATFYVLLPAE